MNGPVHPLEHQFQFSNILHNLYLVFISFLKLSKGAILIFSVPNFNFCFTSVLVAFLFGPFRCCTACRHLRLPLVRRPSLLLRPCRAAAPPRCNRRCVAAAAAGTAVTALTRSRAADSPRSARSQEYQSVCNSYLSVCAKEK